jgi:hypothetical protein
LYDAPREGVAFGEPQFLGLGEHALIEILHLAFRLGVHNLESVVFVRMMASQRILAVGSL